MWSRRSSRLHRTKVGSNKANRCVRRTRSMRLGRGVISDRAPSAENRWFAARSGFSGTRPQI
jgi:hypothetical protein